MSNTEYVATVASVAIGGAVTDGALGLVAGKTATGGSSLVKVGESGGPGAGKAFTPAVKDAAKAESANCVFCTKATTKEAGPLQSNIDHAIPKSRGGNNTINNAQNTCRTCNLTKGTMTSTEFLQQNQLGQRVSNIIFNLTKPPGM